MSSPVDRVAAAAQEIKPLRVLLSVIASPFYVVGFLVGLLIVAFMWAYAAVQVGVADARKDKPDDS